MSYYKYEDENYEMLKFNNTITIKEKVTKKYYEIDSMQFQKEVAWEKYNSKTPKLVYVLVLILGIGMLLFNIYVSFFVTVFYEERGLFFFTMLLLYTLGSAFIHELGHILVLKYYGREYDKIGFKMNYIFPSVYVRMNETYLLTKEEKIMIHVAGLFNNLLINSVIIIVAWYFFGNFLLSIAQIFSLAILMNTAPILNSDGYKLLLAIFSFNEKKEKAYNSKWIKAIGYLNLLICAWQIINIIGGLR